MPVDLVFVRRVSVTTPNATLGERLFETRAPISSSLERELETRVYLTADLSRAITMSAPLQLFGAKRVSLSTPNRRDPAPTYARALRDDDDLIATLLGLG